MIVTMICWLRFLLLICLQILKESYSAIRRARGDGNCFFRSFMFSYLVSVPDGWSGMHFLWTSF